MASSHPASESDRQDTPQDYSAFVGTRTVSERQRFDVAALAAWLSGHVEGFAGPLSIEQFAGGQSNPTFKLVTPSRSYVMRAKPGPAAKLLPSAHAIERFYAGLRRNGHVQDMLPDMMTRAALYDTIGYYDYEALDASIARTVLEDH